MTCSLNLRKGGRADSLTFVLSEARKTGHSEKLLIDLSYYDIADFDDMKDKVMHIMRDAFAATNILEAIERSFQAEDAKMILEAEFFTSDGGGRGSALDTAPEAMQESSS